MIHKQFTATIFVLFCFLFQTEAQAPADIFSVLDSISTQDVPANAPGVAVAVIDKGEVVFQRCAGYANLADSSLITLDTRFNLASNGKQFTALAILLLQHQGKLTLNDDLRKFLPQLFRRVQSRITIRNLLTHTSGIRDVYDLLSLQGITWWQKTMSNKSIIEFLSHQTSLNFEPGSAYLYSNSNYILLAEIVEKASGETFADFTKQMFAKLEMPNSAFVNNHLNIPAPFARPYFNFDTWTTYEWLWDACGDGNFFSTISDQVTWEKIVHGKMTHGIPSQLIQTSQRLVDSKLTVNYGYGIEFGKYKGLPYRFHEGATGAWKATVLRFGDTLSLITLTNTGKSIPAMQTRQMADVLLDLKKDGEYFVTRPPNEGTPVRDEDITGSYLGVNNFVFQFEKRPDGIYLKRLGRSDIRLEREAGNIFRQVNDPDFKQQFTTDAKGNMQVTAYYTTHAPYTLTRTNAVWTGFSSDKIAGKYFNQETKTNVIIDFKQERSYHVSIAGQQPMTGVLVSPTKMIVGNYSLDFSKKGMLLGGDRIRNVQFAKQ